MEPVISRRTVLIISPYFPPANGADMHRVRVSLPYFSEFGWQPRVLAVQPAYIEGAVEDPLLLQTVPSVVPVRRVKALPLALTRRFGLGALGIRSFMHLYRAGCLWTKETKPDLVFFSSTQFPVFVLGRLWKRRFGLPFVLDFQDPWLSDYYHQHREQRPPGGWLRYGFSHWLARRLEPPTLRGAGHVVCVSEVYARQFMQRYPDLPSERFSTLPFGAAESDFTALPELSVTQSLFDPNDGREHWVYIGRGGADMGFAVRAFCRALRRFVEARPEVRARLRVHFAGTDYAPKDRARKTIEPLARECGVDDVVSEQTDRLPYFEVLRCLSDAQALFIPGSDDPGYTASKLYPYVLAKKPLLAVFHEASSVVDILRRTGAGKVVTFGNSRDLQAVADEIHEQWFAKWPLPAPATDWNAFAPYTAREMTRRLCGMFDRVLSSDS